MGPMSRAGSGPASIDRGYSPPPTRTRLIGCCCRLVSSLGVFTGQSTVPATICTGHSQALGCRKLRLKSKAGRTTSTMARRSSSARGARGCDGPNCRCQTHPTVHDPQPHSRRETTPGGGAVAVVSAMTPIAALQRISSEVRDGPHSDSSTSKNLGAWSGVLF